MQQPPNPERGRDTTPREGSNDTLPSTQTNTGTPAAPHPGLTLLHTLQGHTDPVWSVAWSPDGSLLASASSVKSESSSNEGEVRVWRTDTWEPVAVLTGLASTALVASHPLASHPRGAQLVTAGQHPQDILLWQLDLAYLLRQAPSAETVHYKTAKVVLVGESGVGKSGLALVLTGRPLRSYSVHAWAAHLAAG